MNRPKNADTVDERYTPVFLGKTYALRFTWDAMFELEKIYGNMTAALEALFEASGAAVVFISVLTNVSPETVKEYVTPELEQEFIQILSATVHRDYPPPEPGKDTGDNLPKKAMDWDELYFAGRDRLRMSDAEFWRCTPRRFVKLCNLWAKYHLPATGETEVKNDPEAFIAALGG